MDESNNTAASNDSYEAAWHEEGEAPKVVESAVAAAKKAADKSEHDEYITAYADIDNGQSVNGENEKTVKAEDKKQVEGNIATNKEDQAKKENK